MLRCGLLGEKLGHSYSPAIHAELADYEYKLHECAPEDVEAFLTGCGNGSAKGIVSGRCASNCESTECKHIAEWDGLNVTIPYKRR